MKQFSKQEGNKKRANIFMVLSFIILSSLSSFAQTTTESKEVENNVIVNNTVELNTRRQENVSTSSNMNFVLWFMGSKQDPNTIISSDATSTKTKVRTSGIAPNRLLIKAFLKKATNFDTTIV